MSRRSSRLMSGRYYNSDEESDSSSVTNISYREVPVKVFKKKAGARKSGPRTPKRTNSNGGTAGAESPVATDAVVSPAAEPCDPIMRTVPYTTVTPRPALTHSPSRGQTPSPAVPETNFRPSPKLPCQSSVDSSGYSSSEGTYQKPKPIGRPSGAAPSPGYSRRLAGAVDHLLALSLERMLPAAAAVRSKWTQVSALASDPSVRRLLKKIWISCVFLILLILCLWFLSHLLSSAISRMYLTNTTSQSRLASAPVAPAMPAPPAPLLEVTRSQRVDPAVVSTAVDHKMQQVLETLQMKQEQVLLQMKQQLDVDLQIMKAKLDAAASSGLLHLEKEVAQLGHQLSQYQAAGHATADALVGRIQDLEAQNSKLSQELSVIRQAPPAEASTPAVQTQLTPELQHAVEKWLTDRMNSDKTFGGGDACEDCRKPRADKMADFALESQGASVLSTRCSETYRVRSACVSLFGLPLWYPTESPRTVIQGFPVLLPGKCWAFHGVQGTLVISLSHPIRVTHVTLDHLPRYNSPNGRIESAPRDFEVYGMTYDTGPGTLLGTFTYDQDGESSQTFELPNPSDVVYRVVELRVLSNWGQVEYTCLYRFRVHGKMA
ncbi:SUN domain-containing protein 1 isoform X1 [Synchiropus splendidus]|uniref:SUN domain-containing protein 1 isoform X1 n=1 Tax=Synchiropus splendidus TaxID=270530 RepID=UPI00237DE89F|nr:SUN domain-containing protein 1 isoform X1 [Synchiropus splendidus]XP_053714029.1 SUN domain-containing protein 1 isoform X1 [Synchiropus splendidus]XP_053714031.1 SUN domain-containing protein 1 isoform X1 [Synchiropus splendidus]XP_053714032.1 SUN domain-containing protein 1 isoform X1 [Synchiropus splendidus]XP_053714033.1 SUN domain-containing protein 1 isoform X1 [Synchiropus splendidus]XP_053714034.1 SUN domain-containing protein 1 isoform X1 [Synchiropus splendidus]